MEKGGSFWALQPSLAEEIIQIQISEVGSLAMEISLKRGWEPGLCLEQMIMKVLQQFLQEFYKQARKMLSAKSAARYMITGEVLDLQCNLLVRPYGYAKLRVNVIEAGTGRIVHSSIYEGERQSGAYIPGSGTPVPMLGDLASGALQDAVDQALDDPSMRAQLGVGRSMESSNWQPGVI